MRVTKSKLKKIIQEEMQNILKENDMRAQEAAEAEVHLRQRYSELSKKAERGTLTPDEQKEYWWIVRTLEK